MVARLLLKSLLGRLSSLENKPSSILSLGVSGLLVVNDGKHLIKESLVLGVQERGIGVCIAEVEVIAVSMKSVAGVGLVGVGIRVHVTTGVVEVIETQEVITSVDGRIKCDTLGLNPRGRLGCGQANSGLFRGKYVNADRVA